MVTGIQEQGPVCRLKYLPTWWEYLNCPHLTEVIKCRRPVSLKTIQRQVKMTVIY